MSAREIQILKGAADGESSKETAEHYYLANETVKSYRKRIVAKLGAKNMMNAVAIGIRTELIK